MNSVASGNGSAGIAADRWVLGVDVGGTGSRAALEPLEPSDPLDPRGNGGAERRALEGGRVAVASGGSTAPEIIAELIEQVRAQWPDAAIAAVGIGATGLASLVTSPGAALERLGRATGGAPLALAIDAVTAHLGALGGRPGAVVAVGTGAIAIGTDLRTHWRRVGGWGHLWDDRGSAAWIGIEALKAAIQTHDGITDDARALLDAAVDRFGPAHSWPGHLLTREDRAGRLAGFARDVAGLAASGDDASTDIMRRAGAAVAATLAAALDPALPQTASGVGGVFAADGAFTASFEQEFARLAPDAELVAPAGTPLDGAVRLARLVAAGDMPAGHPPFLWTWRG
ncbi:BadF/BadG/BcrA/BcrD ATPase family protein [Agromyces sp. H66]|uniref:N-acetylglucosamine kinase n=1 Tax=Agromyces sp. H66 TaxID=2529859 RepID=UPI00145B8E2F|nr:BadF/BadG/BcrA/BcrD ATPase family protein [Agromyces sp. H66]